MFYKTVQTQNHIHNLCVHTCFLGRVLTVTFSVICFFVAATVLPAMLPVRVELSLLVAGIEDEDTGI